MLRSRREVDETVAKQSENRSQARPTIVIGPGGSARISDTLLAVALVAGLVVWAYWPVQLAAALMFDDGEYLVENLLVRNPGWESVRRFVTEILGPSSVRGYYQPLAMISLMTDCALGGSPENLRVFRATSLALHVLNCVLVFLLLRALLDSNVRTGQRPMLPGAGQRPTFPATWPAALGALLFGLHPGAVESTAWLSDRKTLLAAFFSLAAMIGYLAYVRVGPRRGLFYTLALVAFFLALLSKPTAIPLPLMLLALDFWPLRRLGLCRAGGEEPDASIGRFPREAALGGASRLNAGWRAVAEKIPFFILSLVFAVITYVSQSRTAGVIGGEKYPLWGIILIVCHNVVFYLHKFGWPFWLSAHYPYPNPVTLGQPAVLIGLVGTLVLTIGLWVSLRWTRAALAGWLFFFVGLLPSIGIVGFTPAIAADRFAYLPRVGLVMVLAAGAAIAWQKWARSGAARALIIAGIGVLLLGEAVLTRGYLAEWSDTERFARYLVERAPASSYLRTNLGKILVGQGRRDEAEQHYRLAIRLGKEPEAHLGLAIELARRGSIPEAEGHFREAERLDPNNPITQSNLGLVERNAGRLSEAILRFERAAALRPGNSAYRIRLADALAEAGQFARAAEQAEAARSLFLAAGDMAGAREMEARIAGIKAGRSPPGAAGGGG